MTEQTEDHSATDPAHRFQSLCNAMSHQALTIILDGTRGSKSPWFKTAANIHARLGLSSYAAMNAQFFLLSSQVLNGIEQLEFRKESVREDWRNAVLQAQSVFDAGNFGVDTASVMARCFPSHVLSTLDAISERFQTSGMIETPRDTLGEAFEAMRDAIEECERVPGMPRDLIRVLRHLLAQMEAALSNYEIAGEGGFWTLYKETYATFLKVHPHIAGGDHETSLRAKLQKVTTYAVGATHLTASVATIGQAIALLTAG